MSKLSEVLEILRSHCFWDEALAHHTTIYPDGLGSDYWPIRKWSACGGKEKGVVWIWPECGLHGAWYLLSAWSAAKRGFQVYLPERAGSGLHANRCYQAENGQREHLQKLLRQWHPNTEPREWIQAIPSELPDRRLVEELKAPLLLTDACLRHTSAAEAVLERRLAEEVQADQRAERLLVDWNQTVS